MSQWTLVAHTHAGQIVVGRFDTPQEADDRAAEIRAAQATNPFPAPTLSIESPRGSRS